MEDKWISVDKELPTAYEKVLTYKPKNRFTKIELMKWFEGDELEGITHWQPLPSPPKE